ncbi:EamA family transporter RarD [Bacillus aerolatus]|uniref:EamA family transporter RarD n=1 Tax=Bacillus aerolatus TaxID=2653354 RepID=A0A6I1FGA1_9BACI|nr:EamA family transporter RarD [Bacillus aerolatus]KAB7704394.1 EamA family transporter RarD [Bacillus aerolatus]
MQNKPSEKKFGVLAGMGAYLIWGCLPLYWKLAGDVPDIEILAYRIIWSFVFMIILIISFGKRKEVISEIREVLHKPKTTIAVTMATILITINWFIFIFAVNSNNVLAASLGYYINPMVNVLFATLFLKEKLNNGEVLAVVTATTGVIILAWSHGAVPWAAISMAVTFSLYGLIKKVIHVNTWTGLTLETMLITPLALIYLLFFAAHDLMSYNLNINLVLIGTGVATAIPLLLFAVSTKRIPYTMLGFLQYIAPTIMLVIAVLVFNETFNNTQLVSFIFIWTALIIFTVSNIFLPAKVKKTVRIK